MAGPFVVGQFEFAKGDFLSHPVGPRVWRFWVDVDFVPFSVKTGILMSNKPKNKNARLTLTFLNL